MTLMSLVQFPCPAGLSHQESNPEIPETVPAIDCVYWFSRNTLAPPCGAFCSGNRDLGHNCPVQLWSTLAIPKCPQEAALRPADVFILGMVG